MKMYDEMSCDRLLLTVGRPTMVIAAPDRCSPVISTLISLDTTLCGIATLDAAKHSVYVEKMQRSQSANPFQRSVVFRPFTAAHVCPSIAAAHVHP